MTRDMRYRLKTYLQPAFVICTVVLALGGVVMSKFDVPKEPWPLKKPLDLLAEEDLSPYKVVDKWKIDNKDTLKSLGTEDYIQWVLEDVDAPIGSAVRKIVLFITYYELADRVPHVPEECHIAAGHQLLASEPMEFSIEGITGGEKVPGRHLFFQRTGTNNWSQGEKFSVFYLFSVNGTYADSRGTARLALNKAFLKKRSYFSKVEWNFAMSSGTKTYLSKEEATTAGQKLLSVFLPILESQFWPKEEVPAGD